MKRTSSLFWLAVACLPVVSGCKALAVATTAVKPDGSWTRTVRFRGGSDLGDLKKIFALPHGAPWTTRKEWVKGEAVYTAQRPARLGEMLRRDLVVKIEDTSPQPRLVVNEVNVREIAPGRLEYREVLHWQGQRPRAMAASGHKVLAELKSALPNGLATDADIRNLTQPVMHEMVRIWFGPGSPLFLNGHDDLADRRFRRLLGITVDQRLRDKFGDRLLPAQRLAAARRWVAVIRRATEQYREVEHTSDPSGSTGATIAPLLFSAWLPGKVVATNGEQDDVSGEVFWGLYPEAAAAEDVVLTATCDLNPVSARTATMSRQR